MLIKRLTDTLV